MSLDEYLKRAAEGQSQIYYLSGPNLDALARHPHLEAFRKRNLEVLFLNDPIDEFALTQLHTYEGKDLISIDSADVKFPESTNPKEEAEQKPAPQQLHARARALPRGARQESGRRPRVVAADRQPLLPRQFAGDDEQPVAEGTEPDDEGLRDAEADPGSQPARPPRRRACASCPPNPRQRRIHPRLRPAAATPTPSFSTA